MENLLEDTLNELIGEAIEIKGKSADDFEKGKLFGYYLSISKIFNLVEAFGLSDKLSEKLQKFNSDDLLK